jgi:small subunit ribosomal protein S4
MAGFRQPKHKLSRRFGIDIFGTGGRSLERRLSVPPGGVPRRRRKPSEYALQLEEKQKVKAIYGVREGQFRRYFERAQHAQGVAGANLRQLLERRLDNVVYRLGWARTRPMARQMVSHGHIRVNDHRVNIASYLTRPGETITLSATATEMPTVIEEMGAHRPLARWLAREGDGFTARVLSLPEREDVDLPIDEGRIVAFYSR